MRKIKFRAKSLFSGDWVYGFLVLNSDGVFEINDTKENALVSQYTIGQFTGISDKNRIEIYEGDLVKFYNDIEDEMIVGEVIWNDDFCSFAVVSMKREHVSLTAYWEWEVVGNIYDGKQQ